MTITSVESVFPVDLEDRVVDGIGLNIRFDRVEKLVDSRFGAYGVLKVAKGLAPFIFILECDSSSNDSAESISDRNRTNTPIIFIQSEKLCNSKKI